jgi:hypothetical protein
VSDQTLMFLLGILTGASAAVTVVSVLGMLKSLRNLRELNAEMDRLERERTLH